MPCNAVDKAVIGRRELWMHCGLPPRHEGLHHDPKRPGHHWAETFYFGEFEPGRPKKVATARKVRRCKRCGKEQRTDGANDSCVCKEIGATKRQSIMFADEREKAERSANAKDLDDDIKWILPYQIAKWQEARDNDPDAYYGEF